METKNIKLLFAITGISGIVQAEKIEMSPQIGENNSILNKKEDHSNISKKNENSNVIDEKNQDEEILLVNNENSISQRDEIYSFVEDNIFSKSQNMKDETINNSNKYGLNYTYNYNDWHSKYKGENDKEDKYPYEGVYRRSDDVFLRTISPNSRSYDTYYRQNTTEKDLINSALTNPSGRNNNSNYGITNIDVRQEPIVVGNNPSPNTSSINLNVSTKPMEFDKNKTSITLPAIFLNDLETTGTTMKMTGIDMPALTYTPTNITAREKLMNVLKYYANAGTPIMGQQHGIDVSFSPANSEGYKSEIYAVTGKYPAVIGMHFGEPPTHWTYTMQENVKVMSDYIKKATSLGAILTASSEIPNPTKWTATNPDGKSHDRAGNPDLDEFSATGKYSAQWNIWIQTIVETAKAAVMPDGTPIPWILRVFHEQNGDWPWWGEPNQSHDKIKAAFRRVHDALVAAGVRDQILMAYAPNADFGGGKDLNRYLADYPGDDVIDILAYDAYWQAANQTQAEWIGLVAGDMKMLADHAKSIGKVAGIAEYGRLNAHAMSPTNNIWFQTPVAQALQGTGTAYAMTWAQWSGEYQLPWVGHIAADDLRTAPWLLAPINLNAGSPVSSLVTGNLNISQNVNLDNASDSFYSSNFNLSNIILDGGKTISGSAVLGNKNYILGQVNSQGTAGNSAVQIINKGMINYTGNNTTAIFTDNGTVVNDTTGSIKMPGIGNVGMLGTANSIIENRGNIEIGSQSVGIYGGNELLTNNTWVNKDININNTGNISTIAGSTDSVGIFVANNGAVSNIKSSGNIDLSDATNSIGIAASNGTLQVTGNIITGDNSVGIYTVSENISIDKNSTLSTGSNGINILLTGGNQTLNSETDKMTIGNNSFGYVVLGENNNMTAGYSGNSNSVILGKNSIFLYSEDKTGNIVNYNNLKSIGDSNSGIVVSGKLSNYGNIDFENGVGNVGIYSYSKNSISIPQVAENFGVIKVSQSIPANIGMGMAAGYSDGTGYVKNSGVIKVSAPDSVGMYATGKGSIVENAGVIELSGASRNIGMYVDNGATAINTGTITTTGTGNKGQIGIAVINGILDNRGNINIDATDGYGLVLLNALIKNYGNMNITTNSGAKPILEERIATTSSEKSIGTEGLDQIRINTIDGTITLNGTPQEIQIVDTIDSRASSNISNPVSSVGIYVDTSGITNTNPVNNLGLLANTQSADLIIGTEVTQNTDKKYIKLGQNLIAPFNSMIQNSGINEWNVYSGSLTWMTQVTQSPNGIGDVYLAKIPYTVFAGDKEANKQVYNLLDGLEQRYDANEIGTREKELFNKLNNIGNNEEILFTQAVDEMTGHQYANLQSRIKATGDSISNEVNNMIRDDSDQKNEIKVFGSKDEYKTNTAGIKDYKSEAYGVAYVHENKRTSDETAGWYAGVVNNRFEFKDIGKSIENQTMLKGGVFKKTLLNGDGSLKWTVSGEGFIGMNHINRKFLVVDDIFNAKANYYSYGVGMRNEIKKELKVNEKVSISPYGALNMEYGRFSKIKEKEGEMRLEVAENDYFSIKPEIGAEIKYVQPIKANTNLKIGTTIAYETELGKLYGGDNAARVRHTNANWYNLRNEKENRKGNFKTDLNIGIENRLFEVMLNLGYDTKGDNVRGGLGFKASF